MLHMYWVKPSRACAVEQTMTKKDAKYATDARLEQILKPINR